MDAQIATLTAGRTATIHDLVANPYSLERAGKLCPERDRIAVELYEHNLRELTRILNAQRGMWCVRLTSVGAIDEATRCKVTQRLGRDCFTVFIPAPGERPLFGHTNMLNESQASVHAIMQRDATTIATAQERAHSAHKAGLLSAEDAEGTLADLRRRFDTLPPSVSALQEARQEEADALVTAARVREAAEALAAAEAMPSFESLMAAFALEDERHGRGKGHGHGQVHGQGHRQGQGQHGRQTAPPAADGAGPAERVSAGAGAILSKSARRRQGKKLLAAVAAKAAAAAASLPARAAHGGLGGADS